MDDTVDLLKIKIEKAKRELPLETINAINAIDWRAPIMELRTKKGYTFEQLGDLELETELLLCGLVSPANYPKELEKRMKISRAQVDELVNDMNNLIFNKIQEELVKNVERKKIFAQQLEKQIPHNETAVLSKAGIEIIPTPPIEPTPQSMQTEKLELTTPIEKREDMLKKIEKPEETPHPILVQKLSGSFQTGVTQTEHTIENITKTNTPNTTNTTPVGKKVDPYREMPE